MATKLRTFKDGAAFRLRDIVSAFRAQNSSGKPNQYEVQIFPPKGATTMGGISNREVSLRAESLIMPGRSLETQIASAGAITGPQREYVTQPLFAEEISMIIQSTAGLDERKFFEQWQQLSYDVINFDAGYYNDYIGTLDIYLLNQNNEKTFGLKVEECYPKSIAGLNLAAGPTTEIRKTTVAWTFRKFSPLDAESQQTGGELVEPSQDTVKRNSLNLTPAQLASNFNAIPEGPVDD